MTTASSAVGAAVAMHAATSRLTSIKKLLKRRQRIGVTMGQNEWLRERSFSIVIMSIQAGSGICEAM